MSDFNETVHFLNRFSKNTQMCNFMTNRPVGSELFHAGRCTDGQTDTHDEANRFFLQFCEIA
jgi:hypothetical protein